jgi:lipopolysaccharide transport system ATP-binding protein
MVVTVENLSKRYIIGHQQKDRYLTLRDTLEAKLKGFGTRLLHPFLSSSGQPLKGLSTTEDLWALRDISIEIKEGDRLAIIGRNGAGKTTLLKVLSRVTEPTEGRIRIKGRVASLLEVGTGFHPELTGRENIFLNGAVLGMTRAEIKKKFDEIVAFAEVEKFLDTPIKRYSAGMYVRLAFAVAAHLEPEILLVDEVLAVGDVQFQKKCLGKMEDVGEEGRTVLFVSHNMGAIQQLCSSALLLEAGRIRNMSKDVRTIIKDYLSVPGIEEKPSEWKNSRGTEEYQNDYFKPLEFFVSDENGKKVQMPVTNDSEIWINVIGEVKKIDPALYISYGIYTDDGIYLYGSARTDSRPETWPTIKKGKTTLRSRIPKNFLNEGIYKIELYVGLLYSEWYSQPGKESPAIFLEIRGGLSESPYWTEKRPGLIAPVLDWTN